MAALILSKPMPPEPFAQALRERGFAHPIHTTLEGDVDPATIRWLIAWRLPRFLRDLARELSGEKS